MWDWWHYMQKTDPDFQWKTPIEFYGQVVDQNNAPVADATIDCTWSPFLGEPNKKLLKSDSSGKFVVRDIRGKGLSILISKAGFVSESGGRGSFEYAEFYHPDFHIPDPQAPVVFRLWKLGNSEPMFIWDSGCDLKIDGTPQWFTVSTGKKGGGDLAFSVIRTNETAPRVYDYTLKIEAPGGLALTDEELMFNAPEGPYQTSLSIEQKHGTPGYNQVQSLQFYLKTPEGKFAAVKANVRNHTGPSAQVQLLFYYNPSGSRNLEFDDKKRINK